MGLSEDSHVIDLHGLDGAVQPCRRCNLCCESKALVAIEKAVRGSNIRIDSREMDAVSIRHIWRQSSDTTPGCHVGGLDTFARPRRGLSVGAVDARHMRHVDFFASLRAEVSIIETPRAHRQALEH